jgi:peptidoglycan/LPS O-acetylase OafA/YrhL
MLPTRDGSGERRAPSHHDNFAFLRLMAAMFVLVSHQFALTGRPELAVLGVHSLGGMGVVVFFSISGFLVAQSWQADPHVGRFAMRRLLRVWPGYAAVIIFSAFVIGPIVTHLPLNEYFRHPFFADYLRNLWFQMRASLPLQFEGSSLPYAVNGSLWTIPLELKCYAVMAVLGVVGLLRRPRWLLCLTVVLVLAYSAWQVRGEVWMAAMHLKIEGLYFIEFGACFLMGASLNRFWPLVERQKLAAILITCGVLAPLAFHFGRPVLALLTAVPIAAIIFGTLRWPGVRRFDRFGDLSYGVYLYAFPMQQTLIWALTDRIQWWPRLFLTIAATLGCAYISWHAIEKRALQFKPRARGLRASASGDPACVSWLH